MAYDIKPNPDKKDGGYHLIKTVGKRSRPVNGIVFETEAAAQAYLDRLLGLFEDKK